MYAVKVFRSFMLFEILVKTVFLTETVPLVFFLNSIRIKRWQLELNLLKVDNLNNIKH